ncbi:chorismate-binding protein [Flavobacteriaceae bacterium]|nr:chorismate-binding protein [Flavobacteriaceae bacterium]
MGSKTLEQTLDYLWSKQFPFVLFRYPESNKVNCFYQLDDRLHETESLDIDGFILAAFQSQDATPFIPATHQVSFENPITKIERQEESHLSENLFREPFVTLVKKAKDAIANEGLKKIVVSRAVVFQKETYPCTLFTNLLSLYPAAMISFWHHPKVGTWLGATPERLVSLEHGTLKTMALAGTQVFSEGESPQWTAKENEEQQLVTDQLKTDLEKCYPNTAITISKPFTKKAGNLLHLCTDFELKSDQVALKPLLETIHPTPAVGGIPKDKATAFLIENENYKRRFYAGYLGRIEPNTTQLFVNLRCAQWNKKTLTLYVGAGITASSIPEKEWEETERKAETFLNAL